MPYKDHEQKREAMRRWRREVIPKGYGRWLYARRKLRFEDAERFREAITRGIEDLIVALGSDEMEEILDHVERALAALQTALRESMEAEEALGPWDPDDNPNEKEE